MRADASSRGSAVGASSVSTAILLLSGCLMLGACNALLDIEPASLSHDVGDGGHKPMVEQACDGGCPPGTCTDGGLGCANDSRLERCRESDSNEENLCPVSCINGECTASNTSKAPAGLEPPCVNGQTTCLGERTLALCVGAEYQEILSCPTTCTEGSCAYRPAPSCDLPTDACPGDVAGSWRLRSTCSTANVPLSVYAFAGEPGCVMVLEDASLHVGGVVTISDPLEVEGGADSWYTLRGTISDRCFSAAVSANECQDYGAKLKQEHPLDARCALSADGHCRCAAFTMAKTWLSSEDMKERLMEQAYCTQESALYLRLPNEEKHETAVELQRIENADVATTLFSSRIQRNGLFGASLVVDSDTLIVAAPEEDGQRGAVYAFAFEAERGWVETERVAAPSSETRKFGSALAMQLNTLVVGAVAEDEAAGAVYVFELIDDKWKLQQRLSADHREPNDNFGVAASLSGNLLVVGASGEDSTGRNAPNDNSRQDSGAAYVFRKVDGVWVQEAYLKPDVVGREDLFGDSVSIHGDRIAVGAPLESSAANGVNAEAQDNSAPRSGAAYVFAHTTELGWQQQAYVKAPNTEPEARFGQYVALSSAGTRLAIGANRSSITGQEGAEIARQSGATHVYEYEDEAWNLRDSIAPNDPMAGAEFGAVLTLDDDFAVVGAQGVDRADVEDVGAVYVFERSATGWAQTRRLEPASGKPGDEFGAAVAVGLGTVGLGTATSWIAVGVPRYDHYEVRDGEAFPVFDSGAVQVFNAARLRALRLPPLARPQNFPGGLGNSPGLPAP